MQQPPKGPMPYPTPRPRRSRRWIVILLVLLAIGGGIYWFTHRKPADDHPKRQQATVVLAPVARKDVPVYLTGLGTVQAYNTVTVHSQVDGQLMAVKFREGQTVKAGDTLAQIDPRTFQAQYDEAVATEAKDKANLANARLDLQRYNKLGDSIARQTRDTQVATVNQLVAQVAADAASIASARTQLSYTNITSPINGRTGLRQVDVGNIVHPGDTNGIVVITQLQPIAMIFSLPQQNLDLINQASGGQQKLLTVDALGADNQTVLDHGQLLLVDNQIDTTTGTIKLKAALPNKQLQLWPGAFANARLLLKTINGALTIPTVAIQQGPQGAYVFLYQPDSKKVAMRAVTVSMAQGLDSIITAGLNDGDQVVIDGMAKLQDGSDVALAGAKPDNKPANATDAPAPDAAAHHHHKKD